MPYQEAQANSEIALVDLLDAVLDKGVAIKGDLVISIAGIDLVYLDLRVLIASVETLIQHRNTELLCNWISQEEE